MPEYINPEPPSVDPDEISDRAFERIRQEFPNYEPQESQLATIVITALALRAAEIADLVPLIPKAIFRWFGTNVINYPPEPGGPALASITVYARDNTGYTIDADTNFTIQDSDGNQHLFVLENDAIIPPGATQLSDVILTAQEDGTTDNGIAAGTVISVDALDFVINVTQQGTTSGGLDPETDDDYLSRLSRRLGLVPRPVVAQDFATLAMVNFPQIWRMMALDNYQPGVNEKQTIVHTATAGTFTVNIMGGVSAAINWNEPNATLKTKLEAVGTVGAGNINITGGPLPASTTVEYAGALGSANQAQMTVGTNSLTGGGGAASLAFATTQQGAPPDPAKVANVTVAGIDFEGQALLADLKAQVDALLQANREFGFIVNVIDPSFSNVDATFTFTTFPGYSGSDVEARAEESLAELFSPLEFATPPGDSRGWTNVKTIYHWEVIGRLQQVEGLDRLVTLTLGLNGGAQTATDQNLSGIIPLPRPGTIVGTAV